MKRILIIGANGFVGRATLRALSARKAGELHAIYKTKTPDPTDEITWHQVDILNSSQIDNLIRDLQPTHLIQMAWRVNHGTYWKDWANLDWLTANIQIAKSFVQSGGKRCMFIGTSAEYQWSGDLPLNEVSTPLVPQGLYGAAKLGLYWTLARLFEQEKISWAWARLFNPFGPGEDLRRLIPKTCLRLLNGESIHFDAGLSLRDFLHVEEVGSALATVLLSDIAGPVNIGSGEPLNIREVISQIARVYNCTDQISFDSVDRSAGLPDSVVADVKRLNTEYGWSPQKNFEAHLQETCEWWKNYHIQNKR